MRADGAMSCAWCCPWRAGEPPPSPSHRPLLRVRYFRSSSGASDVGTPDVAANGVNGVNGAGTPLQQGAQFKLGRCPYKLNGLIGRGAHSEVWRCRRSGGSLSNHGRPAEVALKVASAAAESASAERQLRREADALRRLGRGAGSLFPALLGDVQCHGRRCLALPILGPDLYSVQKSRGHSPFPLPFVWACARQLLRALEHLSDVELVHADIKPQNIVLRHALPSGTPSTRRIDQMAALDGSTALTLIDLGSCLNPEQLEASATRDMYVQSRWYRAPEVLLGAPLGPALDVWSVGCVVAELALGTPLLPGESEFNQLARVVRLFGVPPPRMLSRSRNAHAYFVEVGGGLVSDGGASSNGGGEWALRTDRARLEPPLVRYLPADVPLDALVGSAQATRKPHERAALLALIHGTLDVEPEGRWPAARAARHSELHGAEVRNGGALPKRASPAQRRRAAEAAIAV